MLTHYDTCRNCTLIKLNDAGHFAFLDSQTFLQQSACNAGKADGEALRTACASCIVYFANVVASRDAGCDAVPLRYQWLLSSYGLKYELFGK